jgi:hypothetical protein
VSDFLDRFGDQLVVAGEQLSAKPRRRRRGTRRTGLFATAALLATGTAATLAATQPWNPQLGRPEFDGPVSQSSSPVPTGQADLLAVLRRPQTDADRDSKTTRKGLRNLGIETQGVRTASVRLLTASSGEQAVLVSIEKGGGPIETGDVPIANELCLIHANDTACTDTGGLKTGKFMVMGHDIWGLVPDGIKAIEIDYPDGTTRRTDVRDNFYFIAGTPTVERPGPTLPNGKRAGPLRLPAGPKNVKLIR